MVAKELGKNLPSGRVLSEPDRQFVMVLPKPEIQRRAPAATSSRLPGRVTARTCAAFGGLRLIQPR